MNQRRFRSFDHFSCGPQWASNDADCHSQRSKNRFSFPKCTTTQKTNESTTRSTPNSAASLCSFTGLGFPTKMAAQNQPSSKYKLYLSLFFLSWFLIVFLWYPAQKKATFQLSNPIDGQEPTMDPPNCDLGALVYVYELPEKFNVGLLRDCRNLSVYTDMCPHVANRGLGQPLPRMGSPSWYATHQFIAELIFHARVERHPRRTWEPGEATLFYVPFYGGLHASSKFREPDLRSRDALAVEMAEYLSQQPAWQRFQGRDHFLALGRTAWDFMRSEKGKDFGANRLLMLPRVMNTSVLTVERHPWEGTNQHGIPYASYFHPSTLDEMLTWQEKMRRSHRPHLFSFVGATRTGVEKAEVRNQIVKQCAESTRCNPLRCARGASECHDPVRVLGVMSQTSFCMQPPGDSFTRRSVFDSVLAGCIPVFFSPHTAYTQYEWYLPADRRDYSVYIPEEKAGRIEEELLKIPSDEVARMRNNVIDLIPAVTYAHPNATGTGFRDAVDVALEQLLKHVRSKLQLV
ncbi:probable xyloglucan galactosyltransferase GT17 [Magnolia sinica]|uniref:probable xyloglucan galactosyltransferase GT17 n=1 Tax=Magnolia sinica TaxID=86752 RepID=UPI0026583972|nr:probable xyloglucan galactosyltransferase GT17 [Magnolia sinica]